MSGVKSEPKWIDVTTTSLTLYAKTGDRRFLLDYARRCSIPSRPYPLAIDGREYRRRVRRR